MYSPVQSLDTNEYLLLSDFVKTHCGIHLGTDKHYLVESRLAPLLTRNGCSSYREFYFRAKSDPTGALRDQITDAMTTNETYWFRDGAPYQTLQEHLLPALWESVRSGRKARIRIWSAACSTGQEPLSIAICLLEAQRLGSGLDPSKFDIVATDISSSALALARSATYDRLSIERGLSEELRDRYFEAHGNSWRAKSRLGSMVEYRQFNLQDPFISIGTVDLLLCRNVLIYFAQSFKDEIMAKFARILDPMGYLMLGATETLLGTKHRFVSHTHRRSFYYSLS